MSENDRNPSEHDDDDDDEEEEEDGDYCPTKNNAEESSASSDESEQHEGEAEAEEEEEKNDDSKTIKPYDQSKVDELWKTFTSSKPKEEKVVAKPSAAPVEKKVVEFAGEKISVPVPAAAAAAPTNAKRPASAASVLDRLGIGKKAKISVLEKSRLDWQTHKESEALTDDLESHRRGKDSYVEKQAFLQRSETREHDHYLNQIKKK